LLDDQNPGSTDWVDDEQFASLFLGNRIVGLVILNSCEGANTSSNQVFSGTAPKLVQRGVPAVIAMQYPIWDDTAKMFSEEFYYYLAEGWPVDAAIQKTRNAIYTEEQGRRDFATPVLFMRSKDGLVF
jgi:CHAT domain-containing protein